ncbi:DUF1833 family protein [Methylobacillus sp.]|uniref:DUF1833 family protein n=1 Tax=Methylobacillus sp. TaxID=56818 RepID=UPI0012C7D5ED|nr:DUF1833 family protein [Methylobacillus sp.]MPS48553.1 DUF1833 domain-containing protein [Methylobacillus sp.]
MPNPNISEALKEAYASAPSNVVVIDTIEIMHPAFSEPIRVASGYEPIDARLEQTATVNPGEIVTFQPFAFELKLPEVFERGVPELELKIDNVSLEIIRNVELAMPQPELLQLVYRAYLSTDLLNGPHNSPPLRLTITQIEADAMTVTAKASVGEFINKKFPNEEYTDAVYPNLITE